MSVAAAVEPHTLHRPRAHHHQGPVQGVSAASSGGNLTISFSNQTGKFPSDSQVFLAIYGNDPAYVSATDPAGLVYLDPSQQNPIQPLTSADAYVPNFLLSNAEQGVTIPNTTTLSSARILIGYNFGVIAYVNSANGVVQSVSPPNPSNPSDTNNSKLWDFAEFTLQGGTINADTSQVDAFGIPMVMQVTPSDPSSPNGVGVYAARGGLIAAYQQYVLGNAPQFASTLSLAGYAPDGSHTRILSPKDVLSLSPTDQLSTYFNTYIGQVFTHYASTPITIQVDNPKAHSKTVVFDFKGKVHSNAGFTYFAFKGLNGSQKGQVYNVYDPFTPPSWVQPPGETPSQMVFDANAVFADNAQRYPTDPSGVPSQILGNIENQISAAFNRGVALDPYSQWQNGPYYHGGPWTNKGPANYYAWFWHNASISIQGKAYGFPYDDQANASSDVSSASPTSLSFTLGWNSPISFGSSVHSSGFARLSARRPIR